MGQLSCGLFLLFLAITVGGAPTKSENEVVVIHGPGEQGMATVFLPDGLATNVDGPRQQRKDFKELAMKRYEDHTSPNDILASEEQLSRPRRSPLKKSKSSKHSKINKDTTQNSNVSSIKHMGHHGEDNPKPDGFNNQSRPLETEVNGSDQQPKMDTTTKVRHSPRTHTSKQSHHLSNHTDPNGTLHKHKLNKTKSGHHTNASSSSSSSSSTSSSDLLKHNGTGQHVYKTQAISVTHQNSTDDNGQDVLKGNGDIKEHDQAVNKNQGILKENVAVAEKNVSSSQDKGVVKHDSNGRKHKATRKKNHSSTNHTSGFEGHSKVTSINQGKKKEDSLIENEGKSSTIQETIDVVKHDQSASRNISATVEDSPTTSKNQLVKDSIEEEHAEASSQHQNVVKLESSGRKTKKTKKKNHTTTRHDSTVTEHSQTSSKIQPINTDFELDRSESEVAQLVGDMNSAETKNPAIKKDDFEEHEEGFRKDQEFGEVELNANAQEKAVSKYPSRDEEDRDNNEHEIAMHKNQDISEQKSHNEKEKSSLSKLEDSTGVHYDIGQEVEGVAKEKQEIHLNGSIVEEDNANEKGFEAFFEERDDRDEQDEAASDNLVVVNPGSDRKQKEEAIRKYPEMDVEDSEYDEQEDSRSKIFGNFENMSEHAERVAAWSQELRIDDVTSFVQRHFGTSCMCQCIEQNLHKDETHDEAATDKVEVVKKVIDRKNQKVAIGKNHEIEADEFGFEEQDGDTNNGQVLTKERYAASDFIEGLDLQDQGEVARDILGNTKTTSSGQEPKVFAHENKGIGEETVNFQGKEDNLNGYVSNAEYTYVGDEQNVAASDNIGEEVPDFQQEENYSSDYLDDYTSFGEEQEGAASENVGDVPNVEEYENDPNENFWDDEDPSFAEEQGAASENIHNEEEHFHEQEGAASENIDKNSLDFQHHKQDSTVNLASDASFGAGQHAAASETIGEDAPSIQEQEGDSSDALTYANDSSFGKQQEEVSIGNIGEESSDFQQQGEYSSDNLDDDDDSFFGEEQDVAASEKMYENVTAFQNQEGDGFDNLDDDEHTSFGYEQAGASSVNIAEEVSDFQQQIEDVSENQWDVKPTFSGGNPKVTGQENVRVVDEAPDFKRQEGYSSAYIGDNENAALVEGQQGVAGKNIGAVVPEFQTQLGAASKTSGELAPELQDQKGAASENIGEVEPYFEDQEGDESENIDEVEPYFEDQEGDESEFIGEVEPYYQEEGGDASDYIGGSAGKYFVGADTKPKN